MKTRSEREAAIFSAARRLPASQRGAYLDESCQGDDRLRQRVAELLDANEAAGAFLKELAPDAGGDAAASSTGLFALNPTGPSEKPGDRIGRYKLLEIVGEGGCGVVYVAEQSEPVRRRVALKVIKLGMDTKQVVARFEAEKQVLAMMDHPNIAKVLDAGATETGRPYFVMELVRGIRITHYCDQNQLGTKERLDLFIKVCLAIQHAHQKGIIHRDIKPSNILVTLHDVVPVPKVIDFGIAKATEGRLADATIYTQLHQLIGTPAYMSPEQAGMSGLDVDTQSDIYSLGVLLYELLAGRTPFDAKELLASGFDAMRKTIREKEPVSPSTRLATLQGEELTTAARCRSSDAPKLMRQLRGDLDWIVMKCLEKDRARRYETANGLATDVQRYLKDEPVMARSPSLFYRFGKMVRRNQGAFAAMTAVAAALVLGAGVSAWRYANEKRARNEAGTARANEAQLRQRLLQREAVKAKISQANSFLENFKPDQAAMVLDTIPPSLIEPDDDHAAILRRLAFIQAHRDQWKESLASFSILLQVDALNNLHFRDLDYGWCGAVLAELDDTNGYEKFRQAAVTQFIGEKNPITADRISKAILLRPAAQKWMAPLGVLYDEAAQSQNYPGAFDVRSESWACISLALIDYRRGNYVKAAEWCRRSLAYRRADQGNSMARVILAMSHHQLHREDEARFELAYGGAPIDHFFQTNEGHFKLGDPMGTYFDWLDARILLREATALIGDGPWVGGVSPPDARAKFDQMVRLRNDQRYEETEKALNEIPNVVLLLEACETGKAFDRVGWWHLQNGRREQAEACWHTVTFGPDDDGSLLAGRSLAELYLGYAPLLLEMGETNNYEKLRGSALSIFGETRDSTNAMRILTVCLLRAPDASLKTNLDKLAKIVAEGNLHSTNHEAASDASLALFNYRRDDNAQAILCLSNRASLLKAGTALDARFHVLKALAYNGLGQRDQARSELALCAESIEKKFNAPVPSSGKDRSSWWYDWWIDHILLLEAKSLIDPAPESKKTGVQHG